MKRYLTATCLTVMTLGTPGHGQGTEDSTSRTDSRPGMIQQALELGAIGALPAGMRAALMRGTHDSAYEARATGLGTWHASNAAHGFDVAFAAHGAEIVDASASWRFGLQLASWGRTGKTSPVAAIDPSLEAGRVEFVRGNLVEWYQNLPRGLEQGFTVSEAPAGGGNLEFRVALEGGLVPVEAGTDSIALEGEAGRTALRYSGLIAFDAEGRVLPSGLDVDGDEIVVSVDDRGAAYPVTIDPWVEANKITASNAGASDIFGYASSLSGDTLVVGAPDFSSGTSFAYVFERNSGGADNWGEVKKLTAPDGSNYENFADSSTSISGDTIVVGVQGNPYPSNLGAVYVYDRDEGGAGNWGQVTKIVAPDAVNNLRLGVSTAILGDTIVAGATGNSGFSGAVYLFGRDEGGANNWGQIQKLTTGDPNSFDSFGQSVSISGQTIAAGAYDDDEAAASAGAAYIFAGPPPPMPAGELSTSALSCQDDMDGSAGYQIEVELRMLNLTDTDASGYAAFLDYDMGVLAYRGDLSSYATNDFTLHITPITQPGVPLGKLRLDGSVGFSDPPTGADALLATLVFDVLAVCDPVTPAITFEAGGTFPSELSLDGDPIATTLTDPGAYTLDDTPPAFDAFADITQAADASAVDGCAGAIVTWTDPTATDTCDGSPVIVCSPPSGSFFATGGPHTVTCTATDACGNQSMTTFDVTVTATNTFDVEIELASVFTPVTRCIRFMADDCTSVDVSLSFTDHDTNPATPVRAIQTIEMPCGEYTLLCAKDQQHTKWNTVGLSISGAGYVGTSIFSLTGGDTDDDGDVDINDVTLLLFQFGNTAAAGGCPWDGTTRDADFSNNGAVGSEDYTFLLASWLTTSTCACTLPSTTDNRFLPNRKRVETPIEMAVDFHPDGWIDAKDVEVFEKRNGLPHLLSKEMCR